MKRLVRYSLGSVALGSLIVSFVESIRFILESFRRKLKVAGTTPDSWLGKIGGKFCKSSATATELIMNNILRIERVNVIGDVILFLGKLFVSLSSAVCGFLVLDTHKYSSGHNKLSSPLFPVLVCWALGYVVATLFFAGGDVDRYPDSFVLPGFRGAPRDSPIRTLLLVETLNNRNDRQGLLNP
ncbi:Detected protein of confused Function [Hibiscus syriacus]|uniref:Choline transporter-like protein n=1 Tax=Hibiscus syriacus TaxID=106335 RepID=A0A6A3AHY6_HIBSY|nr:Detected protein of confused Function [Hibiscus syriacus]